MATDLGVWTDYFKDYAASQKRPWTETGWNWADNPYDTWAGEEGLKWTDNYLGFTSPNTAWEWSSNYGNKSDYYKNIQDEYFREAERDYGLWAQNPTAPTPVVQDVTDVVTPTPANPITTVGQFIGFLEGDGDETSAWTDLSSTDRQNVINELKAGDYRVAALLLGFDPGDYYFDPTYFDPGGLYPDDGLDGEDDGILFTDSKYSSIDQILDDLEDIKTGITTYHGQDAGIPQLVWDVDGNMVGLVETDSDNVPIMVDGEYNYILDLRNIGNKQKFLTNLLDSMPTLNEWLDENDETMNDLTGSIEYQALKLLVDAIDTDQDLTDANLYGAKSLGFDDYESYTDRLTELGENLNTGIGGMPGISDEERALRERYNRQTIRDQEARAMRMLETVAGRTGGEGTQYRFQADSLMNAMRDSQMKGLMAIADADSQRRLDEFNAMSGYYQQLVENGRMSSQQYLDALQANRSQAAEIYSTQISTMIAENEQYLQMYEDELERIKATINATLASIETEMGVAKETIQFIGQFYDMNYMDEMREWEDLFLNLDVDTIQLALEAGEYKIVLDTVSALIETIRAISETFD